MCPQDRGNTKAGYLAWFAHTPQWWEVTEFVLYLPAFLTLIFWLNPRGLASRIATGFVGAFLMIGAPLMIKLVSSGTEQDYIVAYVYLHIPVASAIMILFLRAYGDKEALHQRSIAEAERQALHDPLTSLENRRGLNAHLELFSEANARHGTRFSVTLIDIDDFKRINDTHGHNAGDEVLREVARILRSTVRTIDHVSRWGGEEFAVALPHTSLPEAAALAERLRTEIRHAQFPNDMRVTASFGVAEYRPGEPIQDLIDRADAALYDAKRMGRDRVQVRGSRQAPETFESAPT